MTDTEKDRIVNEEIAAARNPNTRWVLVLVGLISAAFIGYAVDELFERAHVAEAETAIVSDQADEVTDPLTPVCLADGPKADALPAGVCEAVLDLRAVIDEAEIQDPDPNDPDPDDPDPNDPDPDDPDPNDPDRPNDPDPNDPDPFNDPDLTNDPDPDDEDFNDPENQEPEIDDPDPDDPEQQDPEHDDPDPDDPDPNDPPPYPESFTFEFMGVTYVCTDPDHDRHYECEPT